MNEHTILNASWEPNTFEEEYTNTPEEPTLPNPIPTTKRICLRCNKKFKSTGPGNRICPKCNQHNITAYDLQEVKDPQRSLKPKHE